MRSGNGSAFHNTMVAGAAIAALAVSAGTAAANAGTWPGSVLAQNRGVRHAAVVSSAPGTSAGATGDQLWVRRYHGSQQGFDVAFAVAASPDARTVFVTGYSPGRGSGYDYLTVAYRAATGKRLWVSRYNGPGNRTDIASAVAVSPDGSTVYVTGYSVGLPGAGDDYATVAYRASDGAQLWARRYNGPGSRSDRASSIAVSPGGGAVYVTGGSYGSRATGTDYATVAYRAANGTRLWVRRYNGPASGSDSASGVAVSPGGESVYVTGGSVGAGSGSDYATVAYQASTGARQWVQRYNGPANGDDSATGIAVNPRKKMVYVTGSSDGGPATGSDYATVAYRASTGAQLWAERYDGPGSGTDEAHSVAAAPDGKMVFVTGMTDLDGHQDYGTVAYRAAHGKLVWAASYNGPGNSFDLAWAVAVSPDSRTVYVTGSSVGPGTGEDFATVAYRASTATQLWVGRYNGPANDTDGARAVAVSPDGTRIFVVGSSRSATTGVDFTTIAYHA